MTESPSALLERAAAHLEELAKHFAGYDQAAQEEPARVGSPVQWWVYDATDRMAPRAAKTWIETLNPSRCPPLVEWLRQTARYVRFETGAVSGPEHGFPFLSAKYSGAIAFARAVLGEEER